jgi:uncharacterized protein YndB with AHSA1/START domain
MAEQTDRIEKRLTVKAPRARVWRALTTPAEFGSWFGVNMPGPFTPGARITGSITHPKYSHLTFEITIEKVEPERLFSWRWHPNAVDPGRDYSSEETTLVTFELQDAPGGGTIVTVLETGFDRLPPARRAEAFRGNDEGWTAQMNNIRAHVDQTS